MASSAESESEAAPFSVEAGDEEEDEEASDAAAAELPETAETTLAEEASAAVGAEVVDDGEASSALCRGGPGEGQPEPHPRRIGSVPSSGGSSCQKRSLASSVLTPNASTAAHEGASGAFAGGASAAAGEGASAAAGDESTTRHPSLVSTRGAPPRLADHSTSPEEGTEVPEVVHEEVQEEGTEVPEVVQEEVQEVDKGEGLYEGEVEAGEVRAAAGAWAAAAEAPPSPRVASSTSSCEIRWWRSG